MLSGTNIEYARSYNQRVVLEAIRLFEPISKAEIARQTNLTQPTVASIVGDLVERGVIEATGKRQGQRGQPALELKINPQGAFAIGLHLDRDHLTGVLMDLKGTVHHRVHHELHLPDPDETMPLMLETVQRLRQARSMRPDQLWGVGLAMPGPLEEETGKLVAPPNFPGWDGIAPGKVIAENTGLPVFIESDGLAAAMGEHWYGFGQAVNHFFYVYFGVGLGGAMMMQGRPYRGFWGDMGGIGHIPVEPDGRACPCGGRGCLERYVSLTALYERLERQGISIDQPDDLVRLHRERQPALLDWLESAARYLTPALVTLENLLNPGAVVFGGRLPEPLLDDLLERLRGRLPERRMRGLKSHPSLERARLAEDAASLGAASLPIYQAISPHHHVLLKKPVVAQVSSSREEG